MSHIRAGQLRINWFKNQRKLLNNRIVRFLNAYGIKDYKDDLVMNYVLFQMHICEFYTAESYREYVSIAKDFEELKTVGGKLNRLLTLSKTKV